MWCLLFISPEICELKVKQHHQRQHQKHVEKRVTNVTNKLLQHTIFLSLSYQYALCTSRCSYPWTDGRSLNQQQKPDQLSLILNYGTENDTVKTRHVEKIKKKSVGTKLLISPNKNKQFLHTHLYVHHRHAMCTPFISTHDVNISNTFLFTVLFFSLALIVFNLIITIMSTMRPWETYVTRIHYQLHFHTRTIVGSDQMLRATQVADNRQIPVYISTAHIVMHQTSCGRYKHRHEM